MTIHRTTAGFFVVFAQRCGTDAQILSVVPVRRHAPDDVTGVGDEGETDAVGPWNKGAEWKIVEAPELGKGVENLNPGDGKSSKSSERSSRSKSKKVA